MNNYLPYNSFLWGIGALAIGLLLIFNPENAMPFGVKMLGILMLTIGTIQLIVQLIQNRKSVEKQIPFIAIIAMAFGIMLLAAPAFWVKFFMMLMGLVMIFLAINQILTYRSISKSGIKVSFLYYIFPILMFAAGVLTIFEPQFIATSIVVFVAVWIIMYGLVELISYFALRKR